MRIKKYEAASVHEALKLIKAELGPDALILSSQSVRKNGPFGFLGKPVVEITAAIDSDFRQVERKGDVFPGNKELAFGTDEFKSAYPYPYKEDRIVNNHRSSNIRVDTLITNGSEMCGLPHDSTNGPGSYTGISIKEDLEQIKRMLSSASPWDRITSPILFSANASSFYQGLIISGVDPLISLRLIERLEKMHPSRAGIDLFKWRKSLSKAVNGLIDVTEPFLAGKEKAIAHLLVGPTGVGKTTTLVKLAAQFTLVQKKRVALINIDNYRIGASQQLKIYSQIIKIPMESVSDPGSFRETRRKFADYDLILIDSTGCSQKDVYQIKAMEDFLENDLQINRHLVLSATAKERDLRETIHNFQNLRIRSFIFTKIDESNSFGEIVNQCVFAKKPLSYLTTGQKVPEDIELARAERVAELVIKDIFPATGTRF